MSDGAKPLDASLYFARLTQRLIAALSAPMAQGILYELDFRLRPSGNKGPLATSFAAFCKYQDEQAWTWEHMALCRARCVTGDETLCTQLDEAVITILDGERDIEKTRQDVADMRERLLREKPGRDVFDVKRMDGGMTDIDFLAQYFRLATLRKLNLKPASAPDIFDMLDDDVLDEAQKKDLSRAFEDYTAIIQMVRLCSDEGFDPLRAPPGMTDRVLAYFEASEIAALEHHLDATRNRVREIYGSVLGHRRSDAKREADV
jgi:glutamate-ammonia-ligase adenylyltransferase